jgi:hypothetical protein
VDALIGCNNALPSCIHIAFAISVAGHDSFRAATQAKRHGDIHLSEIQLNLLFACLTTTLVSAAFQDCPIFKAAQLQLQAYHTVTTLRRGEEVCGKNVSTLKRDLANDF